MEELFQAAACVSNCRQEKVLVLRVVEDLDVALEGGKTAAMSVENPATLPDSVVEGIGT